jgi:hypothetical protein
MAAPRMKERALHLGDAAAWPRFEENLTRFRPLARVAASTEHAELTVAVTTKADRVQVIGR